MDTDTTPPRVTHARDVRLDPTGQRVIERRARMFSGSIAEHDFKWSELTPNSQYNEYNAIARIKRETYLVLVQNPEDWPHTVGG